MPNSGSMGAFEKIGAMCGSASKKERASWLGGLPPNGRSTSGGGREAVWRKHWLDPARSRLEYTIGWAATIGIANRKGNGKLHHVKVGMLLTQESVVEGEIMLWKGQGREQRSVLTSRRKNLALPP